MKLAAKHLLTGPGPAVILALACFANTLPNDFVYDDAHIVRDNTNIRDLRDWRAVWLTEWWAQRDGKPNPDPQHDRLYRPLTQFTLALNYAVDAAGPDGRPQPRGFHAVNILLHALATLLVWAFTLRLVDNRAVAAWTAVLFAVHPIHAEAVTGRPASLPAFTLSALSSRTTEGMPHSRRVRAANVPATPKPTTTT